MEQERAILMGSEREPLTGAQELGPVPESEPLKVTVEVRRRNEVPDSAIGQAPLSEQLFAERYGASPDDMLRVRQFATAHGLTVVQESAAQRTVELSGTAAAMGRAFGVELRNYGAPGAVYRSHTGPVTIPSGLHGIVTAVLGLDSRPQAQPRSPR